MRKMVAAVVLCFAVCLVVGCATPYPVGSIYTELKLPVAVTGGSGKQVKTGRAECVSFFGLVAMGDSSIETAMKNGGITKVFHVDWEVKNIIGIGKYNVIVYGE